MNTTYPPALDPMRDGNDTHSVARIPAADFSDREIEALKKLGFKFTRKRLLTEYDDMGKGNPKSTSDSGAMSFQPHNL